MVDHLSNQFSEPFSDRPGIDCVSFHFISIEDNVNLISPFLLIEIYHAISPYDDNKSTDSNEFNLSFFKRFKSLLKEEFWEMFSQFHQHATLPHNFTSFLSFDP